MFDNVTFKFALLLCAVGVCVASFVEPSSFSVWKSGQLHMARWDPIPERTGYVEIVRDDYTLIGPGKQFRISFESGRFEVPLFFSSVEYKAMLLICPDGYCTQGKQGTIEHPYLHSEVFTVSATPLPLSGFTYYGLLLQGMDCATSGRGLLGKYLSVKWNTASATVQLDTDQPRDITYFRPTTNSSNFLATYLGDTYCYYADSQGRFRWSYDKRFCPSAENTARECFPALSSAEMTQDPLQYQWNPITKRGEISGGLRMISGSFNGKCTSNNVEDHDSVIVSDKWDLQLQTVDPSTPDYKFKHIHEAPGRPGLYYAIQDDNSLLRCFNYTQSSDVMLLQLLPGGSCTDQDLLQAPSCSNSSISVRFEPRAIAKGFPGWATFLIIALVFVLVGGIFAVLVYLYLKKWRRRNTYEVFTSNTKSYWTDFQTNS